MKRVLFLTPIYSFEDKGNLFTDLVDQFAANGFAVTVITPKERRTARKCVRKDYGPIRFIEFKCLNYRGRVNLFEKGIATLSLGYQFKHAWKKYVKDESYDILICATLPITYAPMIRYIKKRYDAFCYLLQKDFFPQSAVDLGLMRKESLVYKLFRRIEKQLFQSCDKIGVISPKNIEFILKNNPWMSPEKVECCPNGITPKSDEEVKKLIKRRREIRAKNQIPQDAVVFLYGGNISRAQGIEFVKELLCAIVKREVLNVFILIVGRGNDYDNLRAQIELLNVEYIRIIEYLPKQEYDELLVAADVGVVFLDGRFTIANIPSRTLAHMDMAQPIFAVTDGYTDYREMIEENELGLWSLNGDIENALANMEKLALDHEFRCRSGANARNYLKKYATAQVAFEVIDHSYKSYESQGT